MQREGEADEAVLRVELVPLLLLLVLLVAVERGLVAAAAATNIGGLVVLLLVLLARAHGGGAEDGGPGRDEGMYYKHAIQKLLSLRSSCLTLIMLRENKCCSY